MKTFFTCLAALILVTGSRADARPPITCVADLEGSIRALPFQERRDRLQEFKPAPASERVAPVSEVAEIIRRVRDIRLFTFDTFPDRVTVSDAAY